MQGLRVGDEGGLSKAAKARWARKLPPGPVKTAEVGTQTDEQILELQGQVTSKLDELDQFIKSISPEASKGEALE